MKQFRSFRLELRQNALFSLLGVTPAVSGFSGAIDSQKAFKPFNQKLV